MRCFAAFAAFVLFVTGAAAQLSSIAGRHPSAPILNPSAPLLLPQARPIVVSPASDFMEIARSREYNIAELQATGNAGARRASTPIVNELAKLPRASFSAARHPFRVSILIDKETLFGSACTLGMLTG